MADGSIDSQLGARVMNGIGIMTIERKLNELQEAAAEGRNFYHGQQTDPRPHQLPH
jgi:hypothetical protein